MKQVPSLNGLRAISIFMVIAYHLRSNKFFDNNFFVRYAGPYLFNGLMGVNVFFIISGFLITTLLIKEQEKCGDISLSKFYIRRMIRIFPAYYVFLTVIFILQVISYLDYNSIKWIPLLTYTKQFFPSNVYETEHLWSLSVEEVFYLFWPFIFISLPKNKLNIAVFGIFICVICRLLFYQYPVPPITNKIFSTGDALFIGCVTALKYSQISAWVSKNNKFYLLAVIGIIVSVFLKDLFYHLSVHSNIYRNNIYLILQRVLYGFFGSIGLIPNILVAYLIIFSIQTKNIWYRFLNHRIMVFLGMMSYSIYLWQQIFTSNRDNIHRIPLPVIILLILGIACFSYYIIERPFLKLKTVFKLDRIKR